MRFLFSTLMVGCLFCCPGFSAEPKPQDKGQTANEFEFNPKPVSLKYLQFLPQGYDASADKKWPLILFLHGAGERGTDVWRVNIHGPSKYIAQHPDFPFILVSPLCPPGATWSADALVSLLNEVEAKNKVDRSRVYLTGLSMGGYGSWSLGLKFPERFAAIAPICGGGQAIEIVLASKGYAPDKWAAMKTLGIWTFHGAKDTVVPISETEHMVATLKNCGIKEPNLKFTIYPEAKHDAWTETYNNPKFYEWLLQHQRPSSASSK